MITHTIYEIVGRKVGCTKNLEKRMESYESVEGMRPWFVWVREELHDLTDREAGDIEWEWADRLGYPRGPHYALTMRALSIAGKRAAEMGLSGLLQMSPERLREVGSSGGTQAAKNRTPEQKIEWAARLTEGLDQSQIVERARSAGLVGGKRTAELGTTAFHQRATCQYCGYESNLPTIVYRHNDNCPHKPKPYITSTKRLVRRAP